MYCTKCGYRNSDEARVCQKCGKRLPSVSREAAHGQRLVAAVGQYAGFWRRFSATLVDGAILGAVGGITVAVRPEVGVYVAWIFPFIYIIGFWAWRGQTPGKMALEIKVVRKDGGSISLGQAIVRFVGYIMSTITFFVGYVMIVGDSRKQGLHDRIARTCVVKMTLWP